jgi:hypothetical protein
VIVDLVMECGFSDRVQAGSLVEVHRVSIGYDEPMEDHGQPVLRFELPTLSTRVASFPFTAAANLQNLRVVWETPDLRHPFSPNGSCARRCCASSQTAWVIPATYIHARPPTKSRSAKTSSHVDPVLHPNQHDKSTSRLP